MKLLGSFQDQNLTMTIQQNLQAKLEANFQPLHLEVVNESRNHNVPPNSESHFKVVMVSPKFANTGRVKRHQQVYQIVSEEMRQGVHALALHLYSPDEWQQSTHVNDSPPCLGGSKQDAHPE